MYVLYHHFVQKVKEEQIQRYNQKHKEYLIRTGKLSGNNSKKEGNRNIIRNQNRNFNVKNEEKNDIERKQIQKEESKSRRQRQFNRPSRNGPKQQVQATEYKNERKMQADRPINPNQSQRNYQNQVEESYYPQQNQFRQTMQDQRPIKQNKLTPQEIEYLQQQNQRQPIQAQPQPKQNTVAPKQKQKPINKPMANKNAQYQVYEFKNDELVPCSVCQRKFRPQILDKHEKNCQKVFQQKRKPFEVKKTNQQAEQLKKQIEPQDKKKKGKWKKDSQSLRNMMKAAKGEKVEDDRIQCPGCGRKFNQTAAQKHIQFCTKKKKK